MSLIKSPLALFQKGTKVFSCKPIKRFHVSFLDLSTLAFPTVPDPLLPFPGPAK